MLSFSKGAIFVAIFFSLLCTFPFSATSALSADSQMPSPVHKNAPQILVLNSYQCGYIWTDQIVKAVENKIISNFQQAEIYIEFMDSKRLFSKNIYKLLEHSLKIKYQNIKFDVIIVSDDHALDFMLKYHDKLFPGTPVVFCGINNHERALSVPRNIYTGLIETTDEKTNIDMILQICPKVKKIYVVNDGTTTGLSLRKSIRDGIRDYPKLKLVMLKGEELSTAELLEQLRKVEPYNAVLIQVWFKDKTGKYFSNKDTTQQISKNSRAPVFGLTSAKVKHGLTGGQTNSGRLQGNYAGEMAVRILLGESPKDIPIKLDDINELVFSWPLLQRFGIDKKTLPPGSRIVNKPFSFYRTYKKLVWTVAGGFLTFLLLIIALTINSIRLQKARQQLASSEENLKIILNSIGDAVIATDLHDNIIRMNPVSEAISDWNQSEALMHNFNEIFPLTSPDKHSESPLSVNHTLNNDSGPNTSNQLLQSRDGSEKLVATGYSPIRNEQNETVGLVIVLRDITEETALQNRLHQAERLQSVGMLAGGIAHDFNNMLVGIFGAAEVLNLRIKSEREQRLIKIILNSAKRASLLTSKLLVFSRKENTEFAPSEINSIVQNAISLLNHTIDKKIVTSSTLDATSSIINGDETQLQNAFINIGINASHAMQEGGKLDFSTRNIKLDENYCSTSNFDITPGDYIEVEISDTGSGISPEHINRIFEPFFTTKEQGKGTGLGLAAVYGTVQSHHGAITVYSEVGTGTVFRLYFPVSKQNASAPSVAEEPVFAGEGTILIVDDEEMVRTIAVTILEEIGYEILSAANGEEAIEIYKKNSDRIDLVILDMIMPKLNGRETFEQLKSINPNVKVLISSGFTKEGDFAEMKKNGVLGFIRKPYRRVELCRKVSELISRGKNYPKRELYENLC